MICIQPDNYCWPYMHQQDDLFVFLQLWDFGMKPNIFPFKFFSFFLLFLDTIYRYRKEVALHYFCRDMHSIVQGLWLWFDFLNLTLTCRNVYVKFGLKGVLELWDVDIFNITASFYWTNDVCHLWSYLQTPNLFFGKNSLNVLNVKLFSKFFFQHFGVSFDAFLFQTLIRDE